MSIKKTLGSLKPTAKVAAQTIQGTVVGLVTWLLVTTFWKHGLPLDVAALLPALVGIAWGFVAGWLKKENIVIPALPPLTPLSASISGCACNCTPPEPPNVSKQSGTVV